MLSFDIFINNMLTKKITFTLLGVQECHDFNLGFTTKIKACKGAGQEWNLGVTFHDLGNVEECEGMNPHTPKWASTLGVEVLMYFRILRKQL
jgi:hypothetical protein